MYILILQDNYVIHKGFILAQYPTYILYISINTIMQHNLEQWMSMLKVIKPHTHLFRQKQQDAFVGLERSLYKGVFTELHQKRLMGLFKWLQNNMANTEPSKSTHKASGPV